MGKTEVPPPPVPKSPRPSNYLETTAIGKLPQLPKIDATPAVALSHYPNKPLEDNGALAGSAHLHAKHVPYP